MCAHKYYAVVSGREPGIYNDWPTCQKMVKGYPGAIFKSFTNKTDADNFIKVSTFKPTTSLKHDDLPLLDKTKIYTDGSYSKGQGGYGVVIITPNGDKITAYGKVPLKATNNVAELYAIYVALSLITSKEIVLYSDSMYSVNCFTTWVHNWKLKGWTGVANVELIKEICNKISNRNINFQHVKAHAGHKLNEEADSLANLGRHSDNDDMIIKWNGVIYQK